MALERITTARVEGLFASDLSIRCHPSEATVAAAIRDAVRAHGGVRGCAGEVAAAYGERPEIAAARIRWARDVVESIYCLTVPDRSPGDRGPGDRGPEDRSWT